MTIPHDFDENNPQFTVTCVSSGGPVDCVVWMTNDRRILLGEPTSTLIDAVDGRYVHNLMVNQYQIGPYICELFNNKPDSTAGSISVYRTLLFNSSQK